MLRRARGFSEDSVNEKSFGEQNFFIFHFRDAIYKDPNRDHDYF